MLLNTSRHPAMAGRRAGNTLPRSTDSTLQAVRQLSAPNSTETVLARPPYIYLQVHSIGDVRKSRVRNHGPPETTIMPLARVKVKPDFLCPTNTSAPASFEAGLAIGKLGRLSVPCAHVPTDRLVSPTTLIAQQSRCGMVRIPGSPPPHRKL